MPAKKSHSNKSQNAIRMDDELKERIHEYQKQLEKSAGLEVSFSSAARSLIEKGLEKVKL